jgi:hypothetical protein
MLEIALLSSALFVSPDEKIPRFAGDPPFNQHLLYFKEW